MINKTRRLQWLRALKQFKISVRVWQRLGLLDEIVKQVREERQQKIYHRPAWHLSEWQDLLYDCISKGKPTTELIKGFAQSCNHTMFKRLEISTDDVIFTMEKVLKQYSHDLRVKFGVFNGEE